MPDPKTEIRQEVFYSGRVQGVGFRYTTSQIAGNFEVRGFVRNLPDRRVHLVVEGLSEEIALLLAAVEDRLGDFIKSADTSLKSPATGEFKGFDIRF